MRLHPTTYQATDAEFSNLMLWGERDFDVETNTSREEAFEDLFEGLAHVEKQVVDPESSEKLKKARTLAEVAREFYRAGNYRGGVITIQEAYEQFMDVKVKRKKK